MDTYRDPKTNGLMTGHQKPLPLHPFTGNSGQVCTECGKREDAETHPQPKKKEGEKGVSDNADKP